MNGADVINMSFGGPNSSMVVEDALKSAYTTSILVASAGNDGYVNEDFENRPDSLNVIPNYPASLSYVIGVTSVGSTNVESAFTNIDGKGYTAQEYEVAAPGENILSTLPNNKYGKLSGTSMSAPVISGMAAVLRAYLEDHNKYPTKYIYGQIVGTASQTSICLGREQHGEHNLTKIANLYNALSIYPKPDVELFNYYVFDNKEFSSLNNGDGKMDAGETIYLMPTLINKWGMSEATIISFDVNQGISQEPSQYVKILQSQINFEGIGTYSTKTLLKLSEDQTSYDGILDLNNALKFEISKDAPNGIGVTFNYHIKYKNGIEATDTTDYYDEGSFDLTFNKGIVLPKIISEDTTLTNDNLYILPYQLFVDSGVTLTVNAGVEIQFYQNVTGEIYKKEQEVSIYSKGLVDFRGTKEKPIKIYPEVKEHSTFRCQFIAENNVKEYFKGDYCFINNLTTSINNTNSGYDYPFNFKHTKISYNYNGAFSLFYINSNNQKSTYYGPFLNKIFGDKVMIFNIGSSSSYYTFENCNLRNSVIYVAKDSAFEFRESVNNNTSFILNERIESASFTFKVKPEVEISGVNVDDSIINSGNDNVYLLDLYFDGMRDYNRIVTFFTKIDKCLKNKEIERFELVADNVDPSKIGYGSREQSTLVRFKKDGLNDNSYDVLSANTNAVLVKGYIDYHNKVNEKDLYLVETTIKRNDRWDSEQSIRTIYSVENVPLLSKMYIKTKLSKEHARKQLIKIINEEFYDNSCDSINILANYEINSPVINCEFEKNNDDKLNYFYEGNLNSINLNTDNKAIIDEIINDGHDSIKAPTLVEKGTEKPWLKDCWPFVTQMELTDKNGVKKSTFNNEAMTCTLHFNREMDMNTPLRVRFGSSEPYAEYEIPGTLINGTTWQGTYTLDTTIENGTQRFTIEGGAAADDSFLTVQECGSRFKFNIDTTAAQAMAIQGDPTPEGVRLTWMQDDYETLLGYNVYRCETKDGNYVKVNKSVIGKDENTFLDTGVEPGKSYWYTFTVVFSDLSESKPAGKTACTAYDTMNPNIYHSPVYQGYTSNDLIINCTITDNIGVTGAKVFYRTKGETQYKSVDMTKNNDRYSAKIPSKDINALGLEYYISATDGTNTITKGSETNPFEVVIKDNSTISNKGDVDGDGSITVKDAYMILKHIGGEIILSDEEFRRADLNGNQNLETNEALKILQYINGVISSLN